LLDIFFNDAPGNMIIVSENKGEDSDFAEQNEENKFKGDAPVFQHCRPLDC